MTKQGPSSSGENRPDHDMGYWESRMNKFHQQKQRSESNLFSGLTFYLSGRTHSTDKDAKINQFSAFHFTKLIEYHGGRVTFMFSPSSTTHIICRNLSGAKYHQDGEKAILVLPEYILDCIEASELLSPVNYHPVPPDTSFPISNKPKLFSPTSKRQILHLENIKARIKAAKT